MILLWYVFFLIWGSILDFGITYSYLVLIMTSSVILSAIFGSVPQLSCKATIQGWSFSVNSLYFQTIFPRISSFFISFTLSSRWSRPPFFLPCPPPISVLSLSPQFSFLLCVNRCKTSRSVLSLQDFGSHTISQTVGAQMPFSHAGK